MSAIYRMPVSLVFPEMLPVTAKIEIKFQERINDDWLPEILKQAAIELAQSGRKRTIQEYLRTLEENSSVIEASEVIDCEMATMILY